MSVPKRIQRKRTKGWRMPEGAVYVGRPSKWGNPFQVGDMVGPVYDCEPIRHAGQAVLLFMSRHGPDYPSDAEIRAELAGRDLACWCPLDQPCHADVLLEVANRGADMSEHPALTPFVALAEIGEADGRGNSRDLARHLRTAIAEASALLGEVVLQEALTAVDAVLDDHEPMEAVGGYIECTCPWPNREQWEASEHFVTHVIRAALATDDARGRQDEGERA